MKYQIVRTDKADEQIRDIIFYIAEASGNIDIALSYLAKLEKAIMKLEDFPYSGTVPRYSILKKQGYLVLPMEKHLIFYKVSEQEHTVTIYSVVDGRREYQRLL